jgi:glutathione S-transferase
MSIVLYHHPFTRAAICVWMLEETGIDYDLRFVDVMAGAHKTPEMLALNPMGKLPILTDGEQAVTESAAIGLYLADRYAAGRLAPNLDDPARATYLRWSLFAPSVIEPGSMAKAAGWDVKPGQAGWGTYEAMLDTMQTAIGDGPFLLGERFTMADVVFGGTLRYMLRFKLVEQLLVFTAYADRLAARPACQKADARNAAVAKEHGLQG